MTTPHHTYRRHWTVYQDPTPGTPQEAWAGCSDALCVTGATEAEVKAEIDRIEEDAQ